jgi:hypothetical protein
MSTFTLDVPDELMSAARQIAQATSQPIEQVLLSRLKIALPLPMLPPDEEAELQALQHLSDDALWTIAREQMQDDLQARMKTLMSKNSLGTIASDEYKELETLVDRGQRLMLRKSEAAAILTRRGYTVIPKDLAAYSFSPRYDLRTLFELSQKALGE